MSVRLPEKYSSREVERQINASLDKLQSSILSVNTLGELKFGTEFPAINVPENQLKILDDGNDNLYLGLRRQGELKLVELGAIASGTSVLDASYVVIANTGNLSAERQLGVTAPITLSDGGANGSVTLGFTISSDFAIPNDVGLIVGNASQVAFGEVTAESQVLGTTETDACLGIGLFSETDVLSQYLNS